MNGEPPAEVSSATRALPAPIRRRTASEAEVRSLVRVPGQVRGHRNLVRPEPRSSRGQSSESALAEERERRRIAIGLHDQVGQALALAKIRLLQVQRSPDPAEREVVVLELQRLLDKTITACRTLTFDLSPPVLYELGLDAALQSLGRRLQASHGIDFRYTSNDPLTAVPDELAIILHRSVRELVRNVVRHADAQHVRIVVRRSAGSIRLDVLDDGVGIARAGSPGKSVEGFGLLSIEQQLRSWGGEMVMASGPKRGTRVVIIVPLADPAEDPATPGEARLLHSDGAEQAYGD